MGNITEQVTDESPQLSRNLKSISGLAFVTVFGPLSSVSKPLESVVSSMPP